MMNPKDIAAKKFDKAAMFGYKTEEVDEFLSQISNDYSVLAKEKAEVEKKLEVLADKIREYRSDEDALKDALLGAQRQGNLVISDSKRVAEDILNDARTKADEMIRDAKQESNQLISDAQLKKDSILSELQQQSDRERGILDRLRREVSDFKATLLTMYKAHLNLLTQLPEAEEKAEQNDDMSNELKSDMDEKLVFTEEKENPTNDNADAQEETDESSQDEETQEKEKVPLFQSHAPKNDGGFGELQFGKNKE